MKNIRPVHSTLYVLTLLCTVVTSSLLTPFAFTGIAAGTDSLIVTAEGLADPNNDLFKNGEAALHAALLDDAKKQVIEKVVGLYLDSPSLVDNYSSIDKDILARNQGFIKEVLQKSEPWLGGDGFMHILVKAEVYAGKVEKALREISTEQRAMLIRKAGNPRISVAITVRDSQRSSSTKPERSSIAENILKEHINAFGYRVWSEETTGEHQQTTANAYRQPSDFAIQGEVKFKPIHLKLQTSGIEINKLAITSWTVKCLDVTTGEEIYFNNTIPARRSWNSEDAALAAIGELIGEEFSKEFFEQHLLQRTRMYQLVVQGLPSYDTAVLFKKELIGLRPVLNVNLRSFNTSSEALYEVEFSANDLDFSEILNNTVLKPLNKKFGNQAFALSSVQNLLIKVIFRSSGRPDDIAAQFSEKPPSSLAAASPVRLNQVAATRGALKKVGEINPQGAEKVMEHRRSGGKTSLETMKNF